MPSVRQFLRDNGGRYCLSVAGRETAVAALADAVTARSGPVPEWEVEDIHTPRIEIRKMLDDGSLRLEEEHLSGGAFWAFTLHE